MFDHISIGVKDLERARRFYDAALAPLGYERLSNSDTMIGYGPETVGLWVMQVEQPVVADMRSGLHFCFVAPDEAAVDAFHAAAVASGGTDKVNRVSGRITGASIMPPSSSTRTVTASKPISTRASSKNSGRRSGYGYAAAGGFERLAGDVEEQAAEPARPAVRLVDAAIEHGHGIGR